MYIYLYQGATITSRKPITDDFVHAASRHRTTASHHITEHHGTSQTPRSQSRRITEQSPSRTNRARMHLSAVRGHHAVSHHCPGGVGCQTKTLQHSASHRITAHHGEPQSITRITENDGHHGVRHGASRSGSNQGRSQHRWIVAISRASWPGC